MNASVYRNTRFELRWVTHANSFTVQCSPRDQTPDIVVVDGQERLRAKRGPELELHESLFTEDELRAIHRAEEILENVYARVFDEHLQHPDRAIEAIEQALAAKKERAALVAQSVELRKRNAKLQAECERLEALAAKVKPPSEAT